MYRQTARSARVRAASRGKLLAAARRLFTRKGYAATTMRDVARAARSSVGNLYFYFENKDQLIRTLLEETRTPVWAWADAAAAAAPRGAARVAIITYANVMRLLTSDRDLMRLIAQPGTPPAVSRWAMEVHRTRLRGNLQENFPELSEPQRELAIAAWSGAVRRSLDEVVLGEVPADPEAVAEFVVRWNLRGLGVPEPEVAKAIGTAAQAYAEGAPATQV